MTASPQRAEEAPRRRTWLIVVVLLALTLAVGLVAWGLNSTRQGPAAGTTPSVTSASAGASPSPSPAASTAAPEGCTAVDAGFVPERYSIERIGADEPVVALDLDEEGNIAAPPKTEARMASWWSGGPQPGSDAGQAILTIHTYRNGGAVGNELFADGTSQLQPGDLLRLYGPDGQVQCYEYTDATRIAVSDYDPDSDLMVDLDGAPRLAIIICWDFDPSTEIWNSRVFFHFTPVEVPAP